ncbi:MAG: hypothetical protein DMG15_22480 [Acidobacteria bacterium]|nr:MAG: hypothetical protein DMG15_22480 [Acidobacteriota bacterium]
MDEAAQAQELVRYILQEIIHRPGTQVTPDSPLVSSGLIDSFALVDILVKVEDVTNLRIPAGKIQAKDMDTVNLMLATAKRVGKPRKSK